MQEFKVDDIDKAWFIEFALKRVQGSLALLGHGDTERVSEQLTLIRGGAQAFGFRQVSTLAANALGGEVQKDAVEALNLKLEDLHKKWRKKNPYHERVARG